MNDLNVMILNQIKNEKEYEYNFVLWKKRLE